MAARNTSPLTHANIETADGMRPVGIVDDAAHAKITLRHLSMSAGTAEPMSGAHIRQVREKARLSQAVFARCLNVTTGYVSTGARHEAADRGGPGVAERHSPERD